MSNGFNIDRFNASVNFRGGTLKTNRFQVSFSLPPCFSGDANEALYQSLCRDVELWCDSAPIPGFVQQNMKFRRYGYGSLDSAAVGINFDDIQLRFISDGEGLYWRLFNKWHNKIINSNSLKGMWAEDTENTNGYNLGAYEVGWQEDYETSIFIQWFADNGDEMKLIHLNEATPTAVSPIKMDWGDNGDVARFMVNFSIQDWQFRDGYSQPMNGGT